MLYHDTNLLETSEAFVNWIESLSEDKYVGRGGSFHDCPIGHFLFDMGVYSSVPCVTTAGRGTGYFDIIYNDNYTPNEPWVQKFIAEFDEKFGSWEIESGVVPGESVNMQEFKEFVHAYFGRN